MTWQAVTTNTDLSNKIRYVHSWQFAENAADPGAEARVILKDGTSTAPNVVDIRLPAKGFQSQSYPRPLYFPNGVYVHVTVGTVRGTVDGD